MSIYALSNQTQYYHAVHVRYILSIATNSILCYAYRHHIIETEIVYCLPLFLHFHCIHIIKIITCIYLLAIFSAYNSLLTTDTQVSSTCRKMATHSSLLVKNYHSSIPVSLISGIIIAKKAAV